MTTLFTWLSTDSAYLYIRWFLGRSAAFSIGDVRADRGARLLPTSRSERRNPRCHTTRTLDRSTAFGPISKRRRGFPSETCVGRGDRVVHGDKELLEKLGNQDLCPCRSGRRFQELLPQLRPV